MNKMKTILAATALLTMAGSSGAWANLSVNNQSGKPVWYTIYNMFGRIDWSGCLQNNDTYTPPHGGGSDQDRGQIGYVRGELKDASNCGGKTLSDTGRGTGISIGPHTTKVFVVYGGKLHVQ